MSISVGACLFGRADAGVDFAKQVLPVLRRACFECHGAETQKAGLRLDEKSRALGGGEHGAVIVAGRPDESELLRRVSLPSTDKDAMPRRGRPLSADEVQVLREWITTGAVWPDGVRQERHWAYVKPALPTPPGVKNAAWPRNAIDRFVLARLEKEGLHPSPQAGTAILVRRLHLALTGVPPTVAEVERLEKLGDPLPQHEIEALVDRLLASDQFGVRWARPWLDLARYADSHGFQRDDLREIWGFRDWVVDALNAGMPFDQFTIEQVAGDLLPDATTSQVIATGFHRCTPTNVEAGTEPEESRIHQVLDRVNTTGAAWLGTTLECAQCHDHKYDPFSQEDYYRLLAYFNNTEKEAERANPKVPGSIAFRGVPFEMGERAPQPERQKLLDQMKQVEAQMVARTRDSEAAFRVWMQEMTAGLAQDVSEQVLSLVEFVSEGGAGHRLLEDGSVLLHGGAPDTDTYRMILQGSLKNVTGIKLEALTHESLPGNGPGRGDAKRPNFVLNTFEARLRAADANDDPGQAVKFIRASADFSQKNFDPSGAIDDDPETAWAINPQFGQPHWAVFELESPMDLSPRTELVVTMLQNYGASRTMGRVRVSAVTGALGTKNLPPAIAAILRKPEARRKPRELAQLREHYDRELPGMAAMKQQMAGLEKKLAALKAPSTEVMMELPAPRMTAVFKRGVYTDPAAPVAPGTPAILPEVPGPANRLGLARWLVSKENPLTARVTVNRWWAELFGHGIVTTLEDFGIKGEPPTHPELLDCLAVTFMESGWSMKQMLRLITTSATFCQDAAVTPALLERDDQNLLYARGPRFRLDAEGIRDNALAIAGLLSTASGGPPIYPPQPEGLWRKVGGQQYQYVTSTGEQKYRRGLYVVLKRGAPYPSFVNFDASARMACVVKRSRSNTPLQALTLLNDPVYVEAAWAFADRVLKEKPGESFEAQLTHAFRLALARLPSPVEVAVLKELFQAQCEQGADERAAWFAVTTALLNLDECITKG